MRPFKYVFYKNTKNVFKFDRIRHINAKKLPYGLAALGVLRYITEKDYAFMLGYMLFIRAL
jgi:hypothetical protein